MDEASAAESLAMEPQQSSTEATAVQESPPVVPVAETPIQESTTTKESSEANMADAILPAVAVVEATECSSISATIETAIESSAAIVVETLTKESSSAAADEAAATMEDNGSAKELHSLNGTLASSISACGDSSNENGEDSSVPEEEGSGKDLEYADELMEKGMKAKKADNFVEAIDCFSRALEIRVSHYGELSPECVTAYYNYGCSLLYKAQEEADPLVSVPEKKSSSRNSEGNEAVKSGEDGQALMTTMPTDAKQECGSSANDEELEDGDGDNEKEEGNEGGEGDGEDVSEDEEDESDLNLAWAMLDVARAIVEGQPHDSLEKVDILSALGEVSLEREDMETSLNDYQKALSILECLVEPDSRRIAELNFRICLVLELGEKSEDAVPYCQKALSVCKARLQRLMDEVKNSATTAATIVDTSSVTDLDQKEKQPNVSEPVSSISEREEEIETLHGLLSDLEKKLEDLQQTIVNTRAAFSVLKMLGANSIDNEKGASSSAEGGAEASEKANTSQMAVIGGRFDSPTVSTAATNGNVTHLGVVGRGVKRATLTPIGGEPPAKKPSLESSEEKESSISQA